VKATSLFIKRNTGNFEVNGVDFEMPLNGVVLEIDFFENENISFQNTELRNKKKGSTILILMKSFQGIKEISATNVNIPHGDLLHVDGLWSFKKDEQTINVNT